MTTKTFWKKKSTAVLAIALSGMLILPACTKKTTETTASNIVYPENGTYPVQCEDTITMWRGLNAVFTGLVTNFGDTEIAKELEKRTGVKVEYIHPATGLETEQFNLLIASDDMPDIMTYDWKKYPVQAAFDEGIILPLNDIIDKWAPNYKKVLEERPEIAKMMRTDKGEYCGFGMIRGDESLCTFTGPIIRQDWLDELGLDLPETIDDWEEMLTAFKEKKGADAPLSMMGSGPFASGFLSGAFGVTDTFYIEDGKVVYGAMQPGYKEFVTRMRDWYKKGLLDRDFAGTDRKILTNNVLNSKTGAAFLEAGGGMGTWLDAKRSIGDTKFALAGPQYPVMNKGDRVKFIQTSSMHISGYDHAITTSCKNPELAARHLDYCYSEEGYLLMNYGVEGKTYEMVDGVPTFSEFVTNNPDGMSMDNILVQYAMGSYGGPLIQDKAAMDATRIYKEQNEAITRWTSNTDVKKHRLPDFVFTGEENSELTRIKTDLLTLKDEMLFGFITGTEDLDDYDVFIERMKEIGVEKAIAIYQKALDAYNK